MRRLARIPGWWAAAALLCACPLGGAQSAQPPTPDRLHSVVVWIVNPQNDPNPLTLRKTIAQAIDPLGYKESAAGDFGHTAFPTSQTPGSAGKTMGEFSQPAASAGQTAGSGGTTMGNFGRSASTVGRNAGDAGSTMANFGTSTTNLPAVAAAKNGLIPAANKPRRDGDWQIIVNYVPPGLFPDFEGATFVDVYANDLQALMEAAVGTADAPDVLLGNPLPGGWTDDVPTGTARYVLADLWVAPRIAQTEDVPRSRRFDPEAAVVAAAPNPAGAKAFCLWFWDRNAVKGSYKPSPRTDPIAQLAIRAMLTLLAGASVGADGDPEMAQVSGPLAAAMFAGTHPIALENVKVGAEVQGLRIYGGLAFVAVRATGMSADAFGVANALVILRRDAAGAWKVLQVSPDLEGSAQSTGWSTLVHFSTGSAQLGEEGSSMLRNEGNKVVGISQATPKDGATLSPRPELWWDNLGGATLQAVEWQGGGGEAWGASNFYFIPDNNGRLRTQATARFAAFPGKYRWRVWSIGKGGDLVLSPWRTMNIIGG
jgi:hypothetical protein